MFKTISAALLGATLLAAAAPASAQSYYAREKLDLKGGSASDDGPVAPPASDKAVSITVFSANGDCIQIAEVEAISGGTNVARTGTATSSGSYSAEANASKTIDGVKPAGYPNIYHSQCGGGDFLKITFAQPVKVDSVNIFGRSDGYSYRDNFTYVLTSANGEQIGGGNVDARSGNGSGNVTAYTQPSPPPAMPTENTPPEVDIAYMSWMATEWKRMVPERGNTAAMNWLQNRMPPRSAHITGVHYENAGWYSRYGFSNPEPYIYFSLSYGDWPWTPFCQAWATVRPPNAALCDTYYGNHITFYLNN